MENNFIIIFTWNCTCLSKCRPAEKALLALTAPGVHSVYSQRSPTPRNYCTTSWDIVGCDLNDLFQDKFFTSISCCSPTSKISVSFAVAFKAPGPRKSLWRISDTFAAPLQMSAIEVSVRVPTRPEAARPRSTKPFVDLLKYAAVLFF